MKALYATALIVGLSVMNIGYANNAQYKPASATINTNYSALHSIAKRGSSGSNYGSKSHTEMVETFASLRADAWRKQKRLAHLGW